MDSHISLKHEVTFTEAVKFHVATGQMEANIIKLTCKQSDWTHLFLVKPCNHHSAYAHGVPPLPKFSKPAILSG